MGGLRAALRWYLGAIYVACAVMVLASAVSFGVNEPSRYGSTVLLQSVVVFILLAYLGERTQLQITKLRAGGSLVISLTTPVHIAAILLFPPPYPLLIALVAVLLSQLSHALRARRPLYKRIFNICHPALTVGITSAVISSIAPAHASLHAGNVVAATPFLLLLIGLYYLLDVAILLPVFALLERQSAWHVWQRTYGPALLPELAANAIGILAAVIWDYDPLLLVLFVMPVIALRVAFRAIAQAEDRAAALRQRGEQLEVVLAAGEQLRAQQARVDLLRPVAEAARRLVGATAVAAYLTDELQPSLLRRAVVAPDGGQAGPSHLPLSALAKGIEDVDGALLAPLVLDGGVVGALWLSGVPAAGDREDRDVLAILATQAAIALENARLLAREQDARAEAEAAVRVRNDFLTAASHDLRTPLAAISGRIQLVQMGLADGRDINAAWLGAHMDAARRALTRMVSTVEEITDAAQLQMGHELQLSVEAVQLGELVQVIAQTVSESVGQRKLSPVVLDVAAQVFVQGDRARLERVVQNIVGNAIKYSQDGTPVHIRVSEDDQWAVITVRDHGVGIPDDELPHVFTHFYRASTSHGIAGTGIGLAGSKTIVEQHGGSIALESRVGEGTTVTVRLPRPIPSELAQSIA